MTARPESFSHVEPIAPERPADDPRPLSSVLALAEPTWTACDECGALTSGRKCFDCHVRRDRLNEARGRTMRTVPPAFHWAHFASPLLRERAHGRDDLIQRAKDAVGSARVLLIGLSGAGKTSLAVAMARAWVEHRREPALFVLATDLAGARARNRLGSEPAEIAAAVAAPLLILDDVGTESHVQGSAVVEVVFHRHAHLLPTIITTWIGHGETRESRGAALAARYGDGFSRRVAGDGARIIDLGGA